MGRGLGAEEKDAASLRGAMRPSADLGEGKTSRSEASLTADQRFLLKDFSERLRGAKMTIALSEFSHDPSGHPDLLALSDVPGAEPFAITATGGIASVDRPMPANSVVIDAAELGRDQGDDRQRPMVAPSAIRARSGVSERDLEATRYYRYHGGPPSRDDGPAVVFYDKQRTDEYWLDGRRMSGIDEILAELEDRKQAGINHPTWEEAGEQPAYQTIFYDQDDQVALRIIVDAKSDHEAERKAKEIYHHHLGETRPDCRRMETRRQDDQKSEDEAKVTRGTSRSATRVTNRVNGIVAGDLIQTTGDIDEMVL